MNTLPILQTPISPSSADFPSSTFADTLLKHGVNQFSAKEIATLQVNLGKLCNQTCQHCHVDAGPQRTEIMTRDTMDHILHVLQQHPQIGTIDITGGAPEMNPHFEYVVTQCRDLGRHVIDRCNLTVFFVKGKEHFPQFLAEHRVEIIASLPCYLGENVDQQRGKGVFQRSVEAITQLNSLGYGIEGSGLLLNLVYNPLGPTLPPDQKALEMDFKEELGKRYGISFNSLYTITNMPISRFLKDLLENGQHEAYIDLLLNNFNPASLDRLMCRSLISVGWEGQIYDCDFNQMLELPVSVPQSQHIRDFNFSTLANRPITTGPHCLGCTAGSGSSCGGAVI